MTQTEELNRLKGELEEFSAEYEEQFPSDTETSIFRILGVVTHEKRLTRVLRWLLDPNETHGANSCFLDGFLDVLEIDSVAYPDPETVTVDALERDIGSDDAEIDLLIRDSDICIGVEIKTTHTGGPGKLSKEFKAQRNAFPPSSDSDHYFVYLQRSTTDSTTIPDENFSTLYWGDVVEAVEQRLSEPETSLDRTITRQFVTTIRENVMADFTELRPKTELYLDYDETLEEVRKQYRTDRKRLLKTVRENFLSTRSGTEWGCRRKSVSIGTKYVELRRDNWENNAVRFQYQFSARISTGEQKKDLHSVTKTEGRRPHIDVNLDIKSRSDGREDDRKRAVNLFEEVLDDETRSMLEAKGFVIGWGHSSHYVSKPIFLDTGEPVETVATAVDTLSEIEETIAEVTESDDWAEF